jgi:hypothetical protein
LDKFDLNTVNDYRIKTQTRYLKNSLKSEATLALFDKNCDRKISQSELQSLSKEEYLDNIKNVSDEDYYEYENLVEFLDNDGTITFNELEGIAKTYGLKDKEFKEEKHLRDVTQMSENEILKELTEYGVKIDANSDINSLMKTLNKVREERASYDENSKGVDGHVGTFVQGDNAMCTFLALLDTLSDEQVQSLYQTKTDENGQTVYEVTFPGDSEVSAVITQQEIDTKAIKIDDREVVGFSMGDDDVTMLEMAYTKRFGTDLFDNGGSIETTKNNVFNNNSKLGKNLENLENLDFENLPPNTTIALLTYDDLIEKELSATVNLEDGRTGFYFGNQFQLSDGLSINRGHALSVRGYDKETKELIVSGNAFNTLVETRIPIELMKYFQMTVEE